MGGNGAIDRLGAGTTEDLGRPSNGRPGCGDIVDEEHTLAASSPGRGKDGAREVETAGTGAARLPPQAVSSQKPLTWMSKTACHISRQQLRGRPRAAQPPQGVGRDGADDIDRFHPVLNGDHGRETGSQGMGEIVASSVFERHDHRAEHPVVLPPDHRRVLRWGRLNTVQAIL